jgi:hypothetical protein
MSEGTELVVVYVSQGPLGAEVAQSHAIPAMLRYQAIGRELGLTVDGLGRVEVLVPRACRDTARQLLRETE